MTCTPSSWALCPPLIVLIHGLLILCTIILGPLMLCTTSIPSCLITMQSKLLRLHGKLWVTSIATMIHPSTLLCLKPFAAAPLSVAHLENSFSTHGQTSMHQQRRLRMSACQIQPLVVEMPLV